MSQSQSSLRALFDSRGCGLRPVAEPRQRWPRPRPDRVPHVVTRGTNAEVEVSAGIDWFRGTGPFDAMAAVFNLCCDWWERPVERHGRNFFEQAYVWPNGARLDYSGPAATSQNAGRYCLDFSGSVLAEWSAAERLVNLREFCEVGLMTATRIDLALDVRGESLDLIDNLIDDSGPDFQCVHGFRSRTVYVEYSGQTLRRLGITFGRRGKNGSGRMLRAYDKGLQTRSFPARQWQRLELELSGELAMVAFAGLVGCPVTQPTTIPALVLGCIDFREPRTDGKRCARVRDLPRRQWWADFIAFLGETPDVIKPATRSTPDAFSRRRWRRRCVLASVYRVAAEAGVSPAEVLGLSDVYPRKSDRPLTPGEWQEVQDFKRGAG